MFDSTITLFAARPRTQPAIDMVMLAEQIDVNASQTYRYTMFDEEPYAFHYAIDSIDVYCNRSEDFLRKALSCVMDSGYYLLAWCMYEGAFMDVNQLFCSGWEKENTYAVCFPGEAPFIEMAHDRLGESWCRVIARAREVLQMR